MIYALELVGNKYYIGKSTNVTDRFAQHVSGNGSEWTKMFEPIRIIEQRQIQNTHDEDNMTLDYMRKYGIHNVRGGTWSQTSLPTTTITHLDHFNSDI